MKSKVSEGGSVVLLSPDTQNSFWSSNSPSGPEISRSNKSRVGRRNFSLFVHPSLDFKNSFWCPNSLGPEVISHGWAGGLFPFFVHPSLDFKQKCPNSSGPQVISHGWAGGQANLWFTECTNFPPTWAREEVALFRMWVVEHPKYPIILGTWT